MLPPGRVSLHLLDYEGHRKCLLEPATDVGPRGLVLDPCTALARVLMGASCVYPAPAPPALFYDGLEERLGAANPVTGRASSGDLAIVSLHGVWVGGWGHSWPQWQNQSSEEALDLAVHRFQETLTQPGL